MGRSTPKLQLDAEILYLRQRALISSCKPAIKCLLNSAFKDFAGEGE